MIGIILILTSLSHGPSIHRIEYESHLGEAVFSAISEEPLSYTQLRIRTREMLKDYYGYCPYWIDTLYYDYFQMELLTHIAYFSVEIDPGSGDLGSIPYLSRFAKIRDYGHTHGVRIHMTFTLFGNSSITSFLNNAGARQNAINGISAFMTNYGIEGANIDFEFVTSSVRDSFNLFIEALSNELWNHGPGRKDVYLASIAVPEWYPGYDLDYLADHCDGLFIMAYGFHYSGSSVAGPVSPCVPSSFWGQYCAAKSIDSYKAYGVDGAKIILGLPYYGYDWPTAGPDIGSATSGAGSAVIYYYAFQNSITYGRLWDDYSLTPWYRYQTTEWHQCWYDDSVSLDIKFGMVNDSLLEGAGCWALGYDRSYDHIWNAIRRNFWNPQAVNEGDHPCFTGYNRTRIFSNSLTLNNLSSQRVYNIKIYDSSGRAVFKMVYKGITQINIARDLKPGIYFLFISDTHANTIAKIIKI
jgi:GH18 family chitinase